MLPHGCAMPFRSASENASIVLNELVYALKKPAPASTFQNIADKYIAEISDLQKHFKKGNINQVPTKKIQSQPKIQPKENIPEKQLKTETNKQEKGPHIISPEEPIKRPRVNPEVSPRVKPEGSQEIKRYSLR